MEISLSPIHTATGVLVASAIRDLSTRKKAEDKFRELLEGCLDTRGRSLSGDASRH